MIDRFRRLPPFAQALAFVTACVAAVAIPVGGYLLVDELGSDDDSVPSGPAKQTLKKAMWGSTVLPNGKSLFPIYADLGVGIYQSQIHWELIAPKRPKNPTDPDDPAYTWPAGLAQAIKDAKRNGIETMLMPIGAPAWSNGGHKDWWFAPKNPADWADFMTAASKRYPSVNLWMIWGEPNRAPNFQPLTPAASRTGPLNKKEQVGPRLYAQIVDAAYEALHAVNPKNKVIAGNTFTSAGPDAIYPYQWLRYLRLPNGKPPRMDMWGHNPYGFKKPDLDKPSSRESSVSWGDLEDFAAAIDKVYPDQELPLYLSEWGVPTGFEDKDLLYKVEDDEAEDWIETGLEIARDWDRIYTLGWVHPLDTDRSSQGLMDPEGEPKPSYDAYKGA